MACPTIRAIGVMFRAAARLADITTSAAAPSLTGGALPAVTVPSFLNAGLSAASDSTVVVAADGFVAIDDDRLALLLRHGDRRASPFDESPLGGGHGRPPVALQRVPVLTCTTDLVLRRDHFAGVAHVPILERAPESVVDHRIDDLAVSHSQPFARAVEEIRRSCSSTPSRRPTTTSVSPAAIALRREHHGLETRPAHLVDGQCRDVARTGLREAPPAGPAPVQPGRHDVAHDAFLDRGWVDSGAAHGLADDQGAEFGAVNAFSAPRNLPVGRRDRGDDDGGFHPLDLSRVNHLGRHPVVSSAPGQQSAAVGGNRMGSEIIIVPSLFFAVGFIVYTIVDGYRRRQQTRTFTEFHTRLLDRIGSAKEFGEFFSSDAGKGFLTALSNSEAAAPQLRILRSLQTGLVLLSLGIGFFMLTRHTKASIWRPWTACS